MLGVEAAPVCVYCRRHPVDARWRPFCSERCRLLDLSRWIDGSYRVPDEAVPSEDEDEGNDGTPA
jgi:endogenous inhibitor of DNA gyrase (YacG/DUF329 family)